MNRFAFFAVVSASSLGLLSSVQSAYAVCDGCVVGAVNNMNANVSAQIQGTTQAVIAAQTAIVTALGQSTAQLSGYETRTARSQQRVEDAAQQIETMRQRDLARARAEGGRYDPAASACTDLSGVVQFGGGAGGSSGIGGNDVVNAARNRARGNENEGKEVELGGLAIAQGILADREASQGLGGYLDPTSDVRLLTEAQTLDTSKQEVALAFARLVNNIVDPTPAKPLTESERRTPQGQAQLAARQIDESRRSPAHAVFAYLGDLVAPSGNDGLVEWAKRAAPESYSNTIGDKMSSQQVIDLFVQSRFANPDWHQQLATMAPEAVSREIALTNALNLHVNWMMFQLMRRDSVVNATLLSAEMDNRDTSGTSITTTFANASAP